MQSLITIGRNAGAELMTMKERLLYRFERRCEARDMPIVANARESIFNYHFLP